jgi:hypothetical protein
MVTETYQIEDFVCAEQFESNEEINALHSELGLTGQQTLAVDGKIIPFAEMTKEEHFVYSTLCPHSVVLEQYRQSPIPLRVLQIAKLAKDTGYFDELVVWDRESSAISLDPVLVGIKKDGYNRTFYILARWGKELEAYTILLKKAALLQKEIVLASLETIKDRVDSRIKTLSSKFEFSLDSLKMPSYYD